MEGSCSRASGDPVTVSRHGRRDKTIVYGTLAEDGTRLMRQYGRFDGPTFVRYLKEVRRKWGKVLLVTDNASQHKHREVQKYLEEHDGLEILYLPTATPKLSAVESVWKDAKYRFVTSEHCETQGATLLNTVTKCGGIESGEDPKTHF